MSLVLRDHEMHPACDQAAGGAMTPRDPLQARGQAGRMLIHNGKRRDREPALLECEARPSCGRWVPHVFAGLRRCGSNESAEELYRCTRCGAERRWGIVALSSESPQPEFAQVDR